MNESRSGPDLLNELAYEFAERFRRGERPSLTEYTARYPDLAAEIRDLFPAMVVIEQFGSVGGPPAGPQAQSATSDGTAPQQLGEYRILREVARGGMGIVYGAVQESLGRHVALKVLPFQSLADANQFERFRREAQAAARLHHSNIVPVFGVGEHEGVHYFAMQFIRGQSLSSVLHELRCRRRAKALDAGEPAEAPSSVPAGRRNLELTVTLAEGLRTGRFPGKDEAHRDRPEDGPPPRPDPAGLTFSDGTFNDSDWTIPRSNGLLGAGQVGSGGNPGSYRQTRIFFNEDNDFSSNLSTNFVCHPSTQGAVTGLTFADNLITTNAFGGSYYPLIQQAGVLYHDFSAQENATSNVWLRSSRTLNLGDFTRLDGGAGSPDFTSTGSAIEFGYQVVVTGGFFFESDTGIDNYSLTVSAAAVPEPSSLVMALAGVVIVGVALLHVHENPGSFLYMGMMPPCGDMPITLKIRSRRSR
ncbi:MAG: protein kinase [Isosphaerales bacterium]